jgi:FkbM family methyltransferase
MELRYGSSSGQRVMKRALQSALLGLYKCVSTTGIFSTAWGRALLDWVYLRYKALLEVGDIHALATLVRPGDVVIDVGANIGFFAQRFAKWVRPAGKVIAVEPETVNFERLNHLLKRQGLDGVVETIQAVVAETSGTLNLRINPLNPGDHRIAPEGISVRAICLDDLLAERNWPVVSLMKVDVQGAEERVLLGARRLLEKLHPALFIEIDEPILREMGSSAERIFNFLSSLGYRIHRLEGRRISAPLPVPAALSLCCDGGYTDFLFLYQS